MFACGAWMVSGRDGSTMSTVSPEGIDWMNVWGSDIAADGDVDGDGIADLLIGRFSDG